MIEKSMEKKERFKAQIVSDHSTQDNLFNRMNIAIIFVEGYSDKVFFNRFVNSKCQVFCASDSSHYKDQDEDIRENCRKAVIAKVKEKKEEGIPNPDLICGVVDADYHVDRDKTPREYRHVFQTDTHDLETLIYKTGEFSLCLTEHINNLSKSSGKNEKIQISNEDITRLQKHAFECGKWLVFYRAVRDESEKKNFKIDDKFPPIINFIRINNPGFLLDEFITSIRSRSKEEHSKLKEKMKEKNDKCPDDEEWLWKICNGHDLTRIMKFCIIQCFFEQIPAGVRGKINKTQRSEFEKIFIDNYKIENFQKTQLYQNLFNWNPDIFRRDAKTGKSDTKVRIYLGI
jgi:hypothetical protein